MIHGAPN